MTTLVLQSFGRENEYQRAILTVLSYYAHSALPIAQTQVILFTDDPAYFESYFHRLPVQYVLLTSEKIKQMRGEIDFLHRMKIALIEEAFSLTQGSLLYADSDTFFIKDPTHLIGQVKEDCSFMHVHEYQFEQLRHMPLPAGQPFQAFLKLIESRPFTLPDGQTIKLTAQHSSWNAGVMFFHSSHSKFIPAVYSLTDQFYPPTQNHAAEQYAFSIILQLFTKLQPCDHIIYHYWHRIKKTITDEFLSARLSKSWAELSMPQKLAEVKAWTTQLPDRYHQHVLTLKDNSIQALNENQFKVGYDWAFRAVKKGALTDTQFIRDVFYHVKRQLLKK